MTSSDGEERLLQHISQQLTREMHVARSHHSHVSVITVGGGREVLDCLSPVHARHPKPTRHHEGYASGPMLDGVLATGLHSGEALRLLHPKGGLVSQPHPQPAQYCPAPILFLAHELRNRNKIN